MLQTSTKNSIPSMKKYLPFFVIFILISVHFYSNYTFLKKGVNYGGTDTIQHLMNRIEIHNGINKALSSSISGKERYLQIHNLLHMPGTWPPMIYLVSFFIGSVMNKGTFIVEMSNILYVALLILGVYLLGKKLGGPNTGLLAAFITASFPIVSIWSRRYGLDLPLMSLTPWVMLALLNTAGFTKTKSSALLGLLLGFAILFKMQILIFIFMPLVYVFGIQPDTYSFRIPKVSQVKNLIISIGLAALISCLWWNKNHLYLLFKCFSNSIMNSQPDGLYVPPCPIFSWKGFYYYFYYTEIGLCYLILFILAILHSFLKKEDRYTRDMLLIWVLFPYLLFSLMVCKDARWYVPSLPGIALFISLQVNRLHLHKSKCWITLLILLFGLSGMIKNNFYFKEFAYYNKSAISADRICTLMRENKLYKRDTKLAICVFDGDRITSPHPKSPLLNLRLDICTYNIGLNDPEVEIVNLLKDGWVITDADFVILLLDFTPEEISTLDWEMKVQKKNILRKLIKIRMNPPVHSLEVDYDMHKVILKDRIPAQEIPAIKKVRRSFYSDRAESYLFIPQMRLYYVLQIKKGAMTIEQCAQLLRLPKAEIVLWIDDYNRGGLAAIKSRHKNAILDFNKYYTEYYTQRLSEILNPLLNSFAVVEKNMNADYGVIFLARESPPKNGYSVHIPDKDAPFPDLPYKMTGGF